MKEIDGGVLVTLFKDIYTEEQLKNLGLNDKQIKVVLVAKNHGSISNQKVQEIAGVSKATATRVLTELVEKWDMLEKIGETGVGTSYKLKGS